MIINRVIRIVIRGEIKQKKISVYRTINEFHVRKLFFKLIFDIIVFKRICQKDLRVMTILVKNYLNPYIFVKVTLNEVKVSVNGGK
jgi:hypothetical protein